MIKKHLITIALIAGLSNVGPSFADDLTGDQRAACEAILCLAAPTRYAECNPALNQYYSITRKKWSDTMRARTDFLNLCPKTDKNNNQSIVESAGNGAYQCTASALNSNTLTYGNGKTGISNVIPSYCITSSGGAIPTITTITSAPMYVGTPEKGGYWVEAAQYQQALADYNAKQMQNFSGTSGTNSSGVWNGY